MPPEKQRRRRAVASCTQCYSKKQKCNHQYPCNHCLRRRLPELCTYSSPAPDNDAPPKPTAASSRSKSRSHSQGQIDTIGKAAASPTDSADAVTRFMDGPSSWLGYVDEEESSLFVLLQKDWDVASNGRAPDDALADIRAAIQLLPKRFMAINPPTFLNRYEQWWKSVPGSNLENLEFSVLILRICAYTAQFMPIGEEGLYGIPLTTIREHCHSLASRLSNSIQRMPAAKSLTSVQELFLAACYLKNDGQAKESWGAVVNSIRTAQDIGMHKELYVSSRIRVSDFEKEIRRRTFCNLYLLDRFLSVVLDRLPCIPDEYCTLQLPILRLVPDTEDPDMPDAFQERILQTRFTQLVYSMLLTNKPAESNYDPNIIEERYEKLRREFIFILPPAFSLSNANTKWDERLPDLARQRQSLHMAVYFVLCQLFKPLLKLKSAEIETMVQYRRRLLLTHRNHMVHSALSLLESSSELHRLMGGAKISFFQLIYHTFEATMILAMHLLTHQTTLKALSLASAQDACNNIFGAMGDPKDSSFSPYTNIADSARCRAQIEASLERLTGLAEASPVARVAVRNIRSILAKLNAYQRKSHVTGADDQSGTNSDNTTQLNPAEHTMDGDNWFGLELSPDNHLNSHSLTFDYTSFLDTTALNWSDGSLTAGTELPLEQDTSHPEKDGLGNSWIPVDIFGQTGNRRSHTPGSSIFTASSPSVNSSSSLPFYQEGSLSGWNFIQ